MTCTDARGLLKGAWTASAGLAFTRHFCECPACQAFVKSLAAQFATEDREAMTAQFKAELLPEMARALLTDPEAR